ncbi:hypothetical protein SASPL_111057 [Salvia splendens]|uniref:BZIP domain-containing protein n=1 Tax=Salvia splendens TaxID=180675 RepID=A0A8X9A3A0_SALSN|nr:hypothetical protein SASPL_111057 [Salvia splendens]
MASKKLPTSPGSDCDERKRKRKLSNRESARRSRMKKQQRLDELNGEEGRIKEENKKLIQMIDATTNLHLDVASNNNVLRAQISELTDRLKSLNSVLQIASEVSGLMIDIPDIPDTLLEPWQLPCPIQSAPASVDMIILAVVLQWIGFLLLVAALSSSTSSHAALHSPLTGSSEQASCAFLMLSSTFPDSLSGTAAAGRM